MTNEAKSSFCWISTSDLDMKVYHGVVLLFLRSVLSKLVCLEKGEGERFRKPRFFWRKKIRFF